MAETLLALLPVPSVPKFAVNKNCKPVFLYAEIRTPRHIFGMLAVSDAAAPQQAPQGQFRLGAATFVCLHTASPLLRSKNVHTHITPPCLVYDTNSQKTRFCTRLIR